ncbi:hypothetical protein J31TS4_17790 [Paenibacillus sp. J31TS4]|uniref:GtrA family protein n=1 Tax=Paenibacillus sp. J31TS4 TaxID=2807195 RepID=UPI001B04A3E8|nr:GtrA family protein [Paenibacillus sp. J31TS4]GIP38499.1 hypothetical protein J31TS4_17790 [Paenibacillus sp. J31TS4]
MSANGGAPGKRLEPREDRPAGAPGRKAGDREASHGRAADAAGTPAAPRAGEDRWQGVRRFVKFNLVGVLNTAVDLLLFTILNAGLGVPYAIAQVISYAGGMANSYVWNRYWTFGDRRAPAAGQLVRFAVVNGATLGLSLLLLYLFTGLLGLPALAAKLAVTVITMGLNFIGSKLWVFRG